MHSGRFELTKLTYAILEDNLIHHRGVYDLLSILKFNILILCVLHVSF